MAYWALRWWVRWLLPIAVIVRLSKRWGFPQIWFQNSEHSLELIPRGKKGQDDNDKT